MMKTVITNSSLKGVSIIVNISPKIRNSLFRECIHGAVLWTIGRCRPSLERLGLRGLVRFNDQREERLYSNAVEKHGSEDARRLICCVFLVMKTMFSLIYLG